MHDEEHTEPHFPWNCTTMATALRHPYMSSHVRKGHYDLCLFICIFAGPSKAITEICTHTMLLLPALLTPDDPLTMIFVGDSPPAGETPPYYSRDPLWSAANPFMKSSATKAPPFHALVCFIYVHGCVYLRMHVCSIRPAHLHQSQRLRKLIVCITK